MARNPSQPWRHPGSGRTAARPGAQRLARSLARSLAAGWLALAAAGAVPFCQWDFNDGLRATGEGSDLVPGAAAPAISPAVTWVGTSIAGEPARVAAFSRGTFLRARHALGANGGGRRLNQYTLVLDLNTPARPSGWAALYQSNPANTDDGDWFVNPAQGVGISGNYGGFVADGAWVRLALVVDAAAGTFSSYVDGQPVQRNTGLVVDGRWSLGPEFLLFADEDRENAPGWVNSVQLAGWAMTADEVADLGPATAAGLPRPTLPAVAAVRPGAGETCPAGTRVSLRWEATAPRGRVRVRVHPEGGASEVVAEVAMSAGEADWYIPLAQPPGRYAWSVESVAFPGVSARSDGGFLVTAGAPANPRFGSPLAVNGGFEQELAGWTVVEGRPQVLRGGTGPFSPHGGSGFLHGGFQRPGDLVLRQDLFLRDAGFDPLDLEGAVVEASAWLRNRHPAGTFDDQVFHRVAFLDARGGELGAVRSLVAGDSQWVSRPLDALLPAGTRALRLEIIGRHRRDADHDSLADDLSVRLTRPWPAAAAPPVITKLPMLQGVGREAMTLLWETDHNRADHAVEWGRAAVAENRWTRVESLQVDAGHFVHRAVIGGLVAGQEYVYRVRSGPTVSPVFRFRTAPGPSTPFVTAWWGDNHGGTAVLRTHVENILRHSPDLLCVAGDMVNNGNSLAEWHDFWFKPLEHRNLAQSIPVIFARGNHDGEHALAYAYSALPGNESWFAFDYGNSRFIFLDSEADGAVSPEQRAWLREELARRETRQAAFRIVCFHKPPWSQFWNGGGHTQEPFVIQEWVPLFQSGGVDLVVCGHEHAYHRGETNGVVYVVSGGGGGAIDTERVARWSHVRVEATRHHFDIMTVNGRRLGWETYDTARNLLDEFTL
ncbi:MAG: metallophosphoesterase, partial [Verrucomicrobiota bacterium]